MNIHQENHKQVKPYPTRSLRQYLAHVSVQHSQSTEEVETPTIEIELDIGDGRKEVLPINASTNLQVQAENFCKRHNLQPFVQDLLVQSLKEQYKKEVNELKCQRQAEIVEQLRQIYAGRKANEVLLSYQSEQNPIQQDLIEPLLQPSSQNSSEFSKTQVSIFNKQNKPSINNVSRLICQKYGKHNIIEWQNKRSKQRMQALKREKQERQKADLIECLFHPKVNHISSKVDKQLQESSVRSNKKKQRYERLYMNYQHLEDKKHQLKVKAQAELSFKPNINFISKKIVEGKKGIPQTVYTQTTGHTHCREDEDGCSRPKTGRKPQNRNTLGLPIGQYLYMQARRHSKPQFQIKNQVKALEHSDFLVSILKQKRLKEIFVSLSQPPHEELTPYDIPTSSQICLGPLRAMQPLLRQIRHMEITLTEPEFIEAGLKLINSLTPDEKQVLIFKKNNDENSNPSSNRKAFMRQSSGDLYSRGLAKTLQRQNKLQKNREEKVREQLKKCTFRPVLQR